MSIEHDIFGTAPRAKGINSKNKGNTNERVAAKWMEQWTGQKFARVPQSGGLHWAGGASVSGDVVAQDDAYRRDFLFSIETKHRKDMTLTKNLRGNSKIYEFWRQARRDAQSIGKIPLALFRRDGMRSGVFIVFFEGKRLKDVLIQQGIRPECSGECDGVELNGYLSTEIADKMPYDKLVLYLPKTT